MNQKGDDTMSARKWRPIITDCDERDILEILYENWLQDRDRKTYILGYPGSLDALEERGFIWRYLDRTSSPTGPYRITLKGIDALRTDIYQQMAELVKRRDALRATVDEAEDLPNRAAG